jgi:hypothetical protein
MAQIERDWIERFAKAFLTREARLRIRRRRHRRFFESHVRPTDVFLMGHPKSGNTWLAYMLALLRACEHRAEVNLANLSAYVPGIYGKDVRIADHPMLDDPRIFREEYPIHEDLYPKTIYLLRDPRSAIVSLFHMYRVECSDTTMTLSQFVDDYLRMSGCFRTWNRGLIRWDRQVSQWMKRTGEAGRVCIVRYEEMIKDRRHVLERVAGFAGLITTSQNLDEAAARGSFEAMRELEARHGVEAYPGQMARRGRFIRAGTTAGWKDELDWSLVRRIEAEFGDAMEIAGYLASEP